MQMHLPLYWHFFLEVDEDTCIDPSFLSFFFEKIKIIDSMYMSSSTHEQRRKHM